MSIVDKLLNRHPKVREVQAAGWSYIRHRTEKNVGQHSTIFIERLMENASAYTDLEHTTELRQHPDQSSEEFARLSQLADDLSAGRVVNVVYLRALKQPCEPLAHGSGASMMLVEDAAHELELTGRIGKNELAAYTFVRLPGQSERNLKACVEHLYEALEEWKKRQFREPVDQRPGAWLEILQPRKVFPD